MSENRVAGEVLAIELSGLVRSLITTAVIPFVFAPLTLHVYSKHG